MFFLEESKKNNNKDLSDFVPSLLSFLINFLSLRIIFFKKMINFLNYVNENSKITQNALIF